MLTANRCKVCCLVRLLCLLYSIASYTWESMCQNNFRLLFFWNMCWFFLVQYMQEHSWTPGHDALSARAPPPGVHWSSVCRGGCCRESGPCHQPTRWWTWGSLTTWCSSSPGVQAFAACCLRQQEDSVGVRRGGEGRGLATPLRGCFLQKTILNYLKLLSAKAKFK